MMIVRELNVRLCRTVLVDRISYITIRCMYSWPYLDLMSVRPSVNRLLVPSPPIADKRSHGILLGRQQVHLLGTSSDIALTAVRLLFRRVLFSVCLVAFTKQT